MMKRESIVKFGSRQKMLLLCAMSNKIAYRNFCQQAEDLSIFSQDWYLDAVCTDGDWDVAIVEEKGRIIATMPYFLKQKMGFLYGTIPLHVKYLGPYLIPEKRQLKFHHKYYKALMEQLPRMAHFIQDFSPQVTNWLPFYWQKYQQTVRYTYLLELDDLEKTYRGFSKNIRYDISKATKKLVVDSDLPLKDYFEINKKSFERQGLPIYFSLESLERLDAVLKERNARKIFFAKDEDGNIHSVNYLFWDKNRAYYFLGGNNPQFPNSGAYPLATWEAIQFVKKELDLPIFDFCGSMIEGIERNRRYFGAKQVPYFRIWKYNSTVFQILMEIKKLKS